MNPYFFNLAKRKKRDVLTDLLSGFPSEGMVSKKELKALNRLIDDVPVKKTVRNQQKEVTVGLKAPGKKRERRKKTTHYLTEKISEELENAVRDIRAKLPGNQRAGVTKSQIINDSLALILKEFEVKAENSRLFRIIKKR